MNYWEILLYLLLEALLQTTMGCPKLCSCKWKNGKQAVECSNSDLQDIPAGMDSGTQVLEFSGNTLRRLPDELFLQKQLINLQRFHCSRCRIKVIGARTFRGLTNLVELDLSNNELELVPTESFLDCPSLMRLILNFNPIKSLRKFSFNHLSYLNTLELKSCEISEVDEGAFQGLHSLEWLHLSGNRLKTIRGKNTLPENLKGVELQGNDWECDCHIQNFHAWLVSFSIPLSVEPICNGPPRLAGRIIKSISFPELACLPDISPTTFYLELGEGKNVSLLCHVHAAPEATVSWWFQGQMLQNNSMVAPGVHLVYFIEDGTENKKSELFIYNANAEDNGTFICNAENAAGIAQSNFTIRVILREDPIVIIVSFPFEYLLVVAAVVAVLAIVIITVFIVLIARCQRKRKRQQKRKKSKEVALQYQRNESKCMVLRENALAAPVKSSEEAAVECEEPSAMSYTCEPQPPPLFAAVLQQPPNQPVASPDALRRFQEQNPDLIDGIRREGDGESGIGGPPLEPGALRTRTEPQQLPVACLRASRETHQDQAACVLDPEGYPIDYGLPKMPCRIQCNDNNYYRTLPSGRIRRQSAANPLSRHSREAEFLSRTQRQSSSFYDHYHADIRYTADGYPARTMEMSMNEACNKSSDTTAPSSLPCCASTQWPMCMPANLHAVNAEEGTYSGSRLLRKRSASAQTDTESEAEESGSQIAVSNSKSGGAVSVANIRNDAVNESLTESPDEGYEGEASVV